MIEIWNQVKWLATAFGVISFIVCSLLVLYMIAEGHYQKMWKEWKWEREARKSNLLPGCPFKWKFVEGNNRESIDAVFFIGRNMLHGKLMVGTRSDGIWDIAAFEFRGINSDHEFAPKLKTDIFELNQEWSKLQAYFKSTGVEIYNSSTGSAWKKFEDEVKKINNLNLVERKAEDKK